MMIVHFYFLFSILSIYLIAFFFLIFLRIRSLDVLSLIAKVLSFTDDQLETVGLRVPSKNIFTSIISSFTPAEPVTPSDGEVRTDHRIINILYFFSPKIEFLIFLSFLFSFPYLHFHLNVHLHQLFYVRYTVSWIPPTPPYLKLLMPQICYFILFHFFFLFSILILFSGAIS